MRFFYVRNQRYALQWWDVTGEPKGSLVSFVTSGSIPLRLATLIEPRVRDSAESDKGAAAMVATTHARSKFKDTYWIIPLDSDAPYGKVSFTRQDRRTFIAMFKDSRLIWAGRQPVRTGMEAH